jgi:hypothetical protein
MKIGGEWRALCFHEPVAFYCSWSWFCCFIYCRYSYTLPIQQNACLYLFQ